MNCAHHADASAVAYCRTCGKALCANCTRPVRGVIYCEDCLGARMESTTPASGFASGTVPPAGAVPPAFVPPPVPPPPGVLTSSSGPNPTVAGILAGIFPFGVGAVYTGQYAKGLAHLAIFGLLIAGCNVNGSEFLPVVCGLGIAFFWVYQIMDAVRSARAIQSGMAPPDPYGLAASFGGGTKAETSKVPTGGIVLILLGVVFLLHTIGAFEFGFDRFWPVLLLILGAWLFARNYGVLGSSCQTDPITAKRRLMGPAILFTIGLLWLLENFNGPGFHRTWPIILLVVGGVRLIQGSHSGTNYASPGGSGGGFVPPPTPPVPPPPPAPSGEVKATEVNNG